MKSVECNMEDNKAVIYIFLNHYWKKGRNASVAAHDICSVEGKGTVDNSTARKRIRRLMFSDTDTEGKPRLECASKLHAANC